MQGSLGQCRLSSLQGSAGQRQRDRAKNYQNNTARLTATTVQALLGKHARYKAKPLQCR